MHHPVRGFAVAIAATVALVVPAAAPSGVPAAERPAGLAGQPERRVGRDRRHPVRRDRAQAERTAGREQPRLGPSSRQVVGRLRPLRGHRDGARDGRRGRRSRTRGGSCSRTTRSRARQDPDLLARYKTPLFVNGNIHGNEKEGTDAIVRVIEQWATSTDPAVEQLLQRNRIIFNVTSNPDGRVANTRANAAGYDLNRDLTIASQPEARLIRDLIVADQADHHARPARLRQPDAAAPEHAAAQRQQRVRPLHQARRCRTRSTSSRASIGLGYPEVTRARIPFRDDAPGVWDDFPPIYVPSFAMLQSSIPYTIEAPFQPGSGVDGHAPRRHRHRRPRGRDQDLAEVHPGQPQPGHLRPGRGLPPRLGRASRCARSPTATSPGWGPEDKYNTTFPRSYVIPAGARQRSAPAAKRARRPADRQRRPRHAGQGRVHGRRQHAIPPGPTSSTCTSPSAAS